MIRKCSNGMPVISIAHRVNDICLTRLYEVQTLPEVILTIFGRSQYVERLAKLLLKLWSSSKQVCEEYLRRCPHNYRNYMKVHLKAHVLCIDKISRSQRWLEHVTC